MTFDYRAYREARHEMISAWAALYALAEWHGAEEDALHELSGRFFDGNEASKDALGINHECPCPSSRCADDLRKRGYDVPGTVDCCECWRLGLQG